MLKSKSFLCGDFGAGTLKIVEFEPNDAGSLRLLRYGTKTLGLEGSQDSTRAAVLLKAIQELIAEKGFASRNINICAAGFNVFSKFVKLPAVDTAKVTQIIQYEAQQNVPFPLEEVVWDYQILGTTVTSELEVLLVAIKADVVEGLFATADAAGLNLQLVDASPAALCNAFRFNYGDEEGCTMLLDIGAKTSNLLFFEKGKVFSRSINIGANAITQDFAAESRLSFAEADQIKISQGFVSLGGAYEEPDNPYQAQISKIARQVMTRLHIQMNQTIQFYRGQQGGAAPQRLYLAGGASLMPYTAQFFAEKLNIPVDYLNPLRNIQIDESISLEEIAPLAHTFGELVGLGIRNLAQCPVELNLMPKSYQKRKQFHQKKPYFIAAIFSLVMVVFAYGWFYDQQASARQASVDKLTAQIEPLQQKESQLITVMGNLKNELAAAKANTALIEDRAYWPDLLRNLQSTLLSYELKTGGTNANGFGRDTGVWIESLTPYVPDASGNNVAAAAQRTRMMLPSGSGAAARTIAPPTIVYYVLVRCRAINLTQVAPDANNKFAFGLEEQLKTNPMFVATNTKLSQKIDSVEPESVTFGFAVTIQLKRPITLY